MIRLIYTFFVGLFVAIFLGTGVAVFYPAPKPPIVPSWYQMMDKTNPSQADRRQADEFDREQQHYQHQMAEYNRNVSILALTFAILILVTTLALAERVGIVADGLLLGGVFTLLYGIGRGMATDNNKYRFLVAAIGLAVTIILGYFKFKPTRRPTVKGG